MQARSASPGDRIGLWLALAVVLAAPLPFGSDEPVWTCLWCVLLAGALVLAPARRATGRSLAILAAIALLICGAAAIAMLQTAVLPGSVAQADAAWSAAARALGRDIEAIPAAVLGLTGVTLAPAAAFALALAAGLSFGLSAAAARLAVRVVAWGGLAHAMLALAAFGLDPAAVLGRPKQDHIGYLTGTFMNRNMAAAFLGMVALLWLALLLRQIELTSGARAPSGRVRRAAALAVVVVALLLTGSRAGTVLSLSALALCCGLWWQRRGGRLRTRWLRRGVPLAAVLWLVLVASVFTLRGDGPSLEAGGRLPTYEATLRMVREQPLLGVGAGAFREVFPAYRPADFSSVGIWHRAHNTPLQVAAEFGAPLAAALVCAWLLLAACLTRCLLGRPQPSTALQAGTLLAWTAGLHSLVDFPLQVAGSGIPLAFVIGLAAGSASVRPGLPSREELEAPASAATLRAEPKSGTETVRFVGSC